MIHTIDLSREARDLIGRFTINLIILAEKNHIATDIRTGFPQLMSQDRLLIDRYVNRQLIHFKNKVIETNPRPLRLIDEFLIELEPSLQATVDNVQGIELDSLSVDIFVDAYLPQTQQQRR